MEDILGNRRPVSPLTSDQFRDGVEALKVAYKLSVKLPLLNAEDTEKWLLRLFLEMAYVSFCRWDNPAPAPRPELLKAYCNSLDKAPELSHDFHQNRVHPESACRRAEAIHERLKGQGRVLFLGDDDGISLALRCLGDYQVTALDIDPKVLEWLHQSAPEIEIVEADVRQIPAGLKGSFEAVTTDPVRSAFATHFAEASKLCLKPEGWLFWCDHPDWNPRAKEQVRRLTRRGFELVQTKSNWHSYPATIAQEGAHDRETRWFLELSRQISLWSHLYIFQCDD